MIRCCLIFTLSLLVAGPAICQNRSLFDLWDKDKDGRLAKTELPPMAQRNFERADTDKDGFISRKEDAAFRNRGKGKGRPPMSPLPRGVKKIADLDYAGTDNPKQKLDLYLPESRQSDAPLPVVCWIHGGGWRNGDKANARRVANYAEGGQYAAASIGYRLSGEAQWPSQIEDCKAAIRYLKANADKYGLDPGRIAVWGSSAGGHLVAMLGVVNDDADSSVACVVDFYGPTELLTMNEQGSSMDHDAPDSPESLLIGGPIQENQKKARDASPIHHVSKDDKPILIVHGTKDPLVPHQQSVEFEKALEAVGIDARFISVEGGGHGKGFPPEVNQIVKQFIDFQLLSIGKSPEDRKIKASN